MSFGIKKGTGRAYCRFCRGPIQVGQIAITWGAYRSSGQIHYSPEDCTYLQKRLEGLECGN